MAKVWHKAVLSSGDGPIVTLPHNVLASVENGTQYLKLRASSPVIAKHLASHLENFENLYKPSLAGRKQVWNSENVGHCFAWDHLLVKVLKLKKRARKATGQFWGMPPKQWAWLWRARCALPHTTFFEVKMFAWLWGNTVDSSLFFFAKRLSWSLIWREEAGQKKLVLRTCNVHLRNQVSLKLLTSKSQFWKPKMMLLNFWSEIFSKRTLLQRFPMKRR